MRQVISALALAVLCVVATACSNCGCCLPPPVESSARTLRDDPLQPPTPFKRFKLTNADADTPKKDITAEARRYTDGGGTTGETTQPLVPSSACAPVKVAPLAPGQSTTCPEASVIEIRSVKFTLTVQAPAGSSLTRTSSLYQKVAVAGDPHYAVGEYKYIESVEVTYTGTSGSSIKANVVVKYWKKPQDPTLGTETQTYPNQTF